MRKILFRGKRLDNGEWIQGFLALLGDDYYIAPDINAYTSMGGRGKGRCMLFGHYYQVLPETVGRYTGLTDKNGKKVFERDIVCLLDITVGEIVLECGAFGIGFRKQIDYDYLASEIVSITGCNNTPEFCYNDNYVSLYELYWNYNEENDNISVIEVIGNIHDNPELLEVTK